MINLELPGTSEESPSTIFSMLLEAGMLLNPTVT